jgi:16S rRNA (guanine966-N2)-methyltransferase
MIALSGGAQGYALAPNSGKDGSPRRARGKSPAAAQKKRPGLSNSVRIIGGQWRGRRIRFPSAAELRPTPDRVRETLFNWLQGVIGDARCLDLFAGSGALGLEALSRGAREVTFVERDARVAAALKATLAALAALGNGRGTVVTADAFRYLGGAPRPFDVVFLDPPFAQGWLAELCTLLEHGGWLAPRAYIYLEGAARDATPPLPEAWEMARETRAGEVHGVLARSAQAAARPAGTGSERMGET